jgi:hypothetical protein
MIPSFDERPIDEVERILERMIADGRLAATRATVDDLARARVPAQAGPVFLRIARAHRTLRLPDAEVEIDLHDGEEMTDEIGGWRLRSDPDFLDIRLAPRAEWNATGDVVLDASWTPRGEELCVHSTFAHFIVRAVAGDG